MKLIVGLWNPWEKYTYTKHNVWFLFLDFLQEKEKFWDFKFVGKYNAEISEWIFEWNKTILLKPQTFMNLSWDSLRKIVDFYKIDIDDIIIVYDDMSMDFWKIRFREKWSAGGHNGIKDIIKHFKDQFKRIKIGIWFDERYEVSDWVLSKFKQEELIDLSSDIFPKTYTLLKENV